MDASRNSGFTSAGMETLFRETFSPLLTPLNFQYVGKNIWARQMDLGFKELFYLYPRRPGCEYYPYGGLSFDYVPRIQAGKVRLRPEPKFVRIHLAAGSKELGFMSDWSLDRGADARSQCAKVAKIAVPAIMHWLGCFRSLQNVIEEFDRRSFTDHSFYFYPETALSYAFTLAVDGQGERARHQLDKVLAKSHFDEDVVPLIREHFEKALR